MRASAELLAHGASTHLRLDRSHRAAALAGVTAVAIGVGASVAPTIILLACAGVAFVVLSLRNLAAALAVFTFLIFLERIPSIAGSGVTVTRGAGTILAFAWLLEIRKRGASPSLLRDHPALAFTAMALFTWVLASSTWATDPGAAISACLRFSQGLLLLFIVVAAITSAMHLRWVAAAFVAGAVVSAVVGLAGVTQAETFGAGSSSRLTGGINDPNELAAVLIPAIALALFLLAATRGPLWALLLSVAAAAATLALLLTGSRGGIIGFAVMIVAAVVFAGPLRLRAVALSMLTVGSAALYYLATAPPEALARVTDFEGDRGTGRIDVWTVASAVASDHPVTGVGIGNFAVVEPTYVFRDINILRPDIVVDEAQVVHNTYLHILAELGAVGLLLFGLLVAGAFAQASRAISALQASGEPAVQHLGRGLIVGSAGMLGAFTFLSAQYEKQLPLLLGMLIAMATLAKRREGGQGAAPAASLTGAAGFPH